ncbi:hypothetical protein F511_29520 [Dorcoceras hygrometricum]|uniref:No apical meristem-associated C-terminal domain-containing protein n=1 Tax=Dorcoceras hygrometricum TaxID=472368 RepID=A0A2Z7D3W8_9LAMI|nr:hypothetical protein F511_29520 [Dorcoceras hygrometricum]
MASSARSASYSYQEDIHLCHVYLNISQDPIKGINQSRNQFWTRVEESYNNSMTSDAILVVLQIMDIMIRAKELMEQDDNFKKGFKFDHVWSIMKDMEKFTASSNPSRNPIRRSVEIFDSPQSDTQATDSPKSASPGLSQFELNLSDENIGGSSSQRPLGVKKAKLKKKKDEYFSQTIESIRAGQEKIIEMIEHGTACREQINQMQIQRMQQKQLRILNERDERKRTRENPNYGKYFGDIGGSGSDLPEF